MALPSPYGSADVAPAIASRSGASTTNQGTVSRTPYPSPFFDIARQYEPKSIKELFQHCSYYARYTPLVSTVLYKYAAYPVTDILFETTNQGIESRWVKLLLEQCQLKSFLVETNLDRGTFGNAFISVHKPFVKYLKCPACKHAMPVHATPFKLKNYEFHAKCQNKRKGCTFDGKMPAYDWRTGNPMGVRLVRWDPANIQIIYNEITGSSQYLLELPLGTKNDIMMGRPDVIAETPQTFLEALRENKAIRFAPGSLFHIKRPGISGKMMAWGHPLILPVLRQVFYLNVLQKAQETIFFGYITPMRVMHPVGVSGADSPWSSVNLNDWRESIATEIRHHRRDPLHIPIVPLPIGYQNIGGEGKALMLANEIRVWSELIVTGIGFPPELVFGGMSYSGSNVSLRMLENEFLRGQEDNLSLVRFLVKEIAAELKWPRVDVSFKPFKMADDLQRAAFSLQLVGLNHLSQQNLLEQMDHNPEQEQKRILEELDQKIQLQRRQAEAQAETAGRARLIQARYEGEANKIMQESMPQQVQPAGTPQPVPDPMGEQVPTAEAQQEGQPPPEQAAAEPQPAIGPGGIVGLESPITQQNVQQGASGAMDLSAVAQTTAAKLKGLPESYRASYLGQLKMTSPELAQEVERALASPVQGAPMPQQRAPTRSAATAQI